MFINVRPILLYYCEAVKSRRNRKAAVPHRIAPSVLSVGIFGEDVLSYLIEGFPMTVDEEGKDRIWVMENIYSHHHYRVHGSAPGRHRVLGPYRIQARAVWATLEQVHKIVV